MVVCSDRSFSHMLTRPSGSATKFKGSEICSPTFAWNAKSWQETVSASSPPTAGLDFRKLNCPSYFISPIYTTSISTYCNYLKRTLNNLFKETNACVQELVPVQELSHKASFYYSKNIRPSIYGSMKNPVSTETGIDDTPIHVTTYLQFVKWFRNQWLGIFVVWGKVVLETH